MENLLNLLERKNLCFRSFHKLCEGFVDEIAKGDVTNLETFQKRRQGLINVLEQLEFEVTHWLETEKQGATSLEETLSAEIKTKIAQLLKEKESIVRSILDLDLQILGHIDRVKDDTIRKLQTLQSGRKTISAYRSPLENVESAEAKQALDREA